MAFTRPSAIQMRLAVLTSLAVFAALLATPAHAVPSNCRAMDAGNHKSFESAWGIPLAWLAMTQDVYQRISVGIGLVPALHLCNDPAINAVAVDTPGERVPRVIAVNTGLLTFVGGDADQLAAVMGHEFAHLSLRHRARKTAAYEAHAHEVARDWARAVVRGSREGETALRAQFEMVMRARSVDRDAEREADDKGFSLAVSAGFNPAGARKFYQKWFQTQETRKVASYLDTHPGLGERSGYSARLERNEAFRLDAERAFTARDSRRLGNVVERWIAEVPDSGAAAYYAGMYLLMTGKRQSLVSEALEDAVTFFDGEGLSRLSQEDQYEARMAALSLCVSLHKEGKRQPTLNCLQRLRHPEDVEQFRVATGWRDFILVPSRNEGVSARPLFASQEGDREVFMTNCSHVARERGMKDVRSWRGMREGRGAASPASGSGMMLCNPRTCDCEPYEGADPEPAVRAPRFER